MPLKKNSIISGCKIILILCFFIVSFAFFSLAELKVHNFEGKCSMCHLVDRDDRIFEGIFIKSIDSLCGNCHSDLGLSHPTGMKPAMDIPPGFKLDITGRMTCATCHEIHGEGDNLLTVEEKSRVFCYLCHSEGIISLHGGVGNDAHSADSRYEVTNRNILIDDLSVECISCHDGTLGKAVNIGMGSYSHGGGSGHPIGVDYMAGYAKGDLTHIRDLDVNIKFFDGKIGCGTCHNMYSKERYFLAKSNDGSGLCLECHRK